VGPSKKLLWLLIFLFAFAAIGYSGWIWHASDRRPVTFAGSIEEFQKNGVPNFALPLLDSKAGTPSGSFVKLQNVDDKVILINYWASWCAPCQVEFPDLLNLARKLPKLKILAISVDQDPKSLHEFLQASMKDPVPENFVVLGDSDGNIAGLYGTKKLPETYIINREHKLVRKVISEQAWTSQAFLDFVGKLIEAP
jgi:thiol-disulfide isomerase/thioredoxin